MLSFKAPEFFPDGTTANDLESVDDKVLNTEPVMLDDDIIYDAMEDANLIEELMLTNDEDLEALHKRRWTNFGCNTRLHVWRNGS